MNKKQKREEFRIEVLLFLFSLHACNFVLHKIILQQEYNSLIFKQHKTLKYSSSLSKRNANQNYSQYTSTPLIKTALE